MPLNSYMKMKSPSKHGNREVSITSLQLYITYLLLGPIFFSFPWKFFQVVHNSSVGDIFMVL